MTSPFVRIIEDTLAHCSALKASDLHIAPDACGLSCRARRSGVLVPLENRFCPSLSSRVLLEWRRYCGFNLTDTSRPQDARFEVPALCMDVRASLTPTRYGPKLVLRFLERGREFDLAALGLLPDALANLRKALGRKQGLILITGETGSGKSTLLYAALARGRLNVHSIEDPIEYTLAGITQSQVDAKKDQSFAGYLRALMRQDPDVIFIGEIRDAETARAALYAASTGHLVLSTLHANSAAAVLSRLEGLGVAAEEARSVLTFWSNQKLVPLLCSACTAWKKDEGTSSGCDLCHGSGVGGRKLVLEWATQNTPVTPSPVSTQLARLAADGLISQEVCHAYS
jgi:general secretion pathway protein E